MITYSVSKEIADYLKTKSSVLACYLYGSYAKKESNPKSDMDLAVVFSKETNSYDEFFKISQGIIDILKKNKIMIHVDLQPLFFNIRSPLFYFEVIKSNMLIYQKDSFLVSQFELSVFRKFRDYQKINRIKNFYMKKLFEKEQYGYSKH